METRIVCAAIRAEDGMVMTGIRHYSGEMYQESIKFQFVGRLKEFIDANKAAIDEAIKESK